MLHYYCYIFLFVCVNAIEIIELHELFHEKACISAATAFMKTTRAEGLMIEKGTESVAINTSETKITSAKGVTARLNELAQFNQITYSYELLSEEGPPHNKKFLILLKLGDESYKGTGSNHKKAMQDAAALALEMTSYDIPAIKLDAEMKTVLTPKALLNNVAMKLGFSVAYYLLNGKEEKEINSYGASDVTSFGKSKNYVPNLNSSSSIRTSIEEEQISGPFTVKLKAVDSEFIGIGHTIKSAQHDAATKALKYLEKYAFLQKNVCSDEDNWEECKKQKELLKTPISRLNEAAQKLDTSFDCKVISESGKPHKKIFTTRCTLGDYVAEGVGTSKKESKRLAAEEMFNNHFAFEPMLFNKNTIIKSFSNSKNKRKKKMVAKNNEKSFSLTDISNVLTSFWKSVDGNKNNIEISDNKNKEIKSNLKDATLKHKLLELGNQFGIQIEFTDIDGSGDEIATLVSLGVEPSQICLGMDASRENAHEKAALHALKFLYKSGIIEKIELKENDENGIIAKLIMEDDDGIIYTMIENTPNPEKKK